MKVRLRDTPDGSPRYIEVAACECCRELVPCSTDPLDAHGHCPMCQEPREVACTKCHEPWREDEVERGLCRPCQEDAELAEEVAAAE